MIAKVRQNTEIMFYLLLSTIFWFCSRPKCVDEVAFQEEVVAVLKKSLEGADVSRLACNESPNADLDCLI